jgi:cobyrinic acid a,c-diamide synthase
MCGPDSLVPLAARAGDDGDVLVVEGVMGLFDGAADGTPTSTADVARALEAPVVLVVDAGAMSASVAALVSGFARFDPALDVAGVILNRVGSDGHETLLRDALAPLGLPVLGALRRDDRLTWRDRHLGLVPVAEHPQVVADALAHLAAAVAERVDLEAVVRIARRAPARRTGPPPLPPPVVPDGAPVAVAVAAGRAFTFTYTDTVDALEAAGLDVVPFDPARDERLPSDVSGLIAGGGFPEVHAAELAANAPLLADVRDRIGAGLPTWAECGGLLWLCESLDGRPMVGAVPAHGHMTDRLTLGYRAATAVHDGPVVAAGAQLRGHEFHYSAVEPAGDALRLSSRWGERSEGFAGPSLLATYLHVHPGGDPSPVTRFARACAAHAARTAAAR